MLDLILWSTSSKTSDAFGLELYVLPSTDADADDEETYNLSIISRDYMPHKQAMWTKNQKPKTKNQKPKG